MHDLGNAPGTELPREFSGEPPTTVRWRILALLMAYAGMCHFNRISISVAGTEHIMAEYGISETRMGWVYSSYLFVYTLCMIPGGWVIDRFGPKRALLLLGFGSAVLVPITGLTGLAGAAGILAALCLVRGLMGMVNAPMHPAAARAVSFWIPPAGRGLANGMVTGAAVVGISVTYLLFGRLMDLVGWQWAFGVSGFVTLLVAIVWMLTAADRPGVHSDVNEAERLLIEGAGDASLARAADSIPLANATGLLPPEAQIVGETSEEAIDSASSMFTNRSLIVLTISYAMYSYFQYLFFYWMQFYFDNELKLGKATSREYTTLAMLAMAVGMLCGGVLGDRMQSRFPGRYSRAVAPACGMAASALFMFAGLAGDSSTWVLGCFSLSMAALGASESAFWVTGIELGGKRGGLSAAILNAVGNVGGILAPIITPYFSSYFGWKAGLCLAAVVCFGGAVLWLWIDPRERVADGES